MNTKKESEKSLNIYQKIQKVQNKVEELIRDEKNKSLNYLFFTEKQVLQKLKLLLEENNLVILASDDESKEFVCEKPSTMFLVRYWKKIEIVNTENPKEKLTYSFAATGQNTDPAKAKGSAETYAIKYFLAKFFLIPVKDEDDPDYYPKKIPEQTYNPRPTINNEKVEEIYQLFKSKRGNDMNKQRDFFIQIDEILNKAAITGTTTPTNFRDRLANLTELDYQNLKNWLNNLN